MTRTIWVLALAASLAGCKQDKAPAVAVAFKKLGALPLEAEVPTDANIDDTSRNAGFPSVTIYASPTIFVAGGGDATDLKPSIDDARTQLGKDPNKLKTITREENTADGWVIELIRDSMMEPGKDLFGVAVRRTINASPWDCSTNAATIQERAKAEKLCRSLRAAK